MYTLPHFSEVRITIQHLKNIFEETIQEMKLPNSMANILIREN